MSTNTPETFEAHGHLWQKHTPGDPMPCDRHAIIIALLANKCLTEAHRAKDLDWSACENIHRHPIIGWRYKDAHHSSSSHVNHSWEDKQIAGLDESLRAAKRRILKDEAELTRLREENAGMRTVIQYAWEAMAEIHCPNLNDALIKRATLAKLELFTESK